MGAHMRIAHMTSKLEPQTPNVFSRLAVGRWQLGVLVLTIGLMSGLASAARAQDWIEYQNNEDGFKVNFPAEPKITDIPWVTEQGYIIPARIYSGEQGSGNGRLELHRLHHRFGRRHGGAGHRA